MAPFSRRVWPADGSWVEATDGAVACRDAVHACRVRDLPMWIRPELWQVELEGPVAEHDTKIAARAGRLMRRIDAWNDDAAKALKVDCAFRARGHVVLAMGGPNGEAAELAAAGTLPEIEAIAAQLEEHGSERARAAAGYAKDAANMASWEWPATLAFIAAHAAEHAEGADAMAAERSWQAHWLADRLGL
jgi:hypothetical protein